MRMYIQIDSDGYVRDAIEYAYGDYAPVEVTLPLPDGAIGGWYKWEDGFVFDQQKYDELHRTEESEDMRQALEILDVEPVEVVE